MSEKFSGVVAVRELVIAVAGPRECLDRATWLRRAARRAGITFRQAKALFYGEITDPFHRSARKMRDAAEQRAGSLAGTFEHAARALEKIDPDFHRGDIAALIGVARELRGRDRAGTDGEG